MKPDKELVKEWFKELGFESIHEMTKHRFNTLMKWAYEEGYAIGKQDGIISNKEDIARMF